MPAGIPLHQNLPQYLFNKARAQYYARDFTSALSGFQELQKRFAAWPDVQAATYFAANCHYALSHLADAIRGYANVFAHAQSKRLVQLSITSLASFEPSTVADVIATSGSANFPSDFKCRLAGEIARILDKEGQSSRAASYRSLCASPDTAGSATSTGVARARILRIAVLAPMSGELQEFGQALYNGAVMAADAAQHDNSYTVLLTPFDTRGDATATGRVAKDILAGTFDAVVGPLTSEEAAVASAVMGCAGFPMIIPAATGAGLTAMNPACFQLSPNLELQGVLMAEYAVRTLSADSAVVIAAESVEQAVMTQAFVERFKALGGTVVAVERYRERDKDFSVYISDIKTLVLGHTPDSAVYLDERGDTLEAEAIPAHVDCCYVPGSPDRVRQLLTQLRFYNVSTTFLGSDGWTDESLYNLGDDVTRGAVFPSAFVLGSEGPAFGAFQTAYSLRYGTKPQRVAALGYDAVLVLVQAAVGSGGSRAKLVDRIAQISSYDGVAGKATFGSHRENIELPLYRISAGRPYRVGLTSDIVESLKSSR